MDSGGESTVRMPPPPPPPPMSIAPPPPPMPSMLNNASSMQNGRSQLLADIRKGASLKKSTALNDLNHNVSAKCVP